MLFFIQFFKNSDQKMLVYCMLFIHKIYLQKCDNILYFGY